MATYLVTGSSRGLGLELVRQLAALPPAQVGRIFATARNDSWTELSELIHRSSDRVVFVRLDTTDYASIKKAVVEVAQSLGSLGLDVLINNAGIMPTSPDGLRTDIRNAFGIEADLPVAAGATAVLEAVHQYGKEENGKFYNIRVAGWEEKEGLNQYDGLNPPW
ncbi:MAG: hypothetical protein Q9203_000456 [Teloschistes exilis]